MGHLSFGAAVAAVVLAAAGAATAQTSFSFTGPAVPIADGADLSGTAPGAPASASVTASGLTGVITNVVLSIDGTACSTTIGSTTVGIDHTFVNDLEITLQSPDGTQVKVIDNTDGSGNNLCQVVLDDASVGPSIQSVVTANAPFTGSYTPANPLAALNGGAPNGTWTLIAQDFFSSDVGNIRAFTITVASATPAPAIPSLTEWAMILLTGVLGLFGAGMAMRRRRQTAA